MREPNGNSGLLASFVELPPPSNHPWEGRFHGLLALSACAVALISLCGYHFCQLTVSLPQAIPVLLLSLLLLFTAAQYRIRGERKCFQVVMMVFWIILVTNSHFFPMYMAARHDVELNDALLARLDSTIGLEVPAILAMIEPYPIVELLLLQVYMTLVPLMTAAAVLPALANRFDDGKRFIVGCIVAATISLPIFACLQAVGPWDYYGFEPPIAALGGKEAMLLTLKTDSVFVIDVTNRDGLITFPSFHVVLTVLAAAALWPLRPLRWPVVIWAALIVISTVATGIHYSVDVLGGLAVAAFAYACGCLYLRCEYAIGLRWPVRPRLQPATTL
jgi:membrane-associated phospholipid phosphatase